MRLPRTKSPRMKARGPLHAAKAPSLSGDVLTPAAENIVMRFSMVAAVARTCGAHIVDRPPISLASHRSAL